MRHSLSRWAVAFLSVVASVLLLGTFIAPPAALAQTTPTPVTLVGNTGQNQGGELGAANDRAQPFTTGSDTEGYVLTSVELEFGIANHTVVNPSPSDTVFTMEIWSAKADGSPNTLLHTLTGPTIPITTEGKKTFSAPAGTDIMLAASTTYHVVWHVSTRGTTYQTRVKTVTTGSEDSDGAFGWSMGDTHWIRTAATDNTFTKRSDTRPVRMTILGYSNDSTAPILSSAEAAGRTLTLVYNDTLDTGSVPAASAFTVEVGGTEVALAATNPVAIGGARVSLTLAAAVTSSDTVTVSYAVPSSNPIQDNAGNDVAALTGQPVTVDSTAPSFLGATVDGTTLSLYYDETLDTGSVPAASAFTVTVDGTGVALAATNPVAVFASTVTLTLASAVSVGSTVTLDYTVPSSNPIQDPSANAAVAQVARTVTVTDTSPPVLQSASVEGTALTLTFDEALDTGSVPAKTAFGVTVGTADAVNPTQVAITGSKVTLTLATAVDSTTVTLSYTLPSQNPLQDGTGNSVASFTDQSVTIADTTRPTNTGSHAEGKVLTLTFSEPLDENSVPSTGHLPVTVDGVTVDKTVDVSGATVILTMDLAQDLHADNIVVWSYNAPQELDDPSALRDPFGNTVASISARTATIGDTTPPVFVSAEAYGATLILTFSEPLETASVPAASSFTVKVDGAEVSLAATNPVAVSGETVTLTLAEGVTEDSTVTVSYTVPSSNPIRDKTLNGAAAFTDEPVTVIDTTSPTLQSASVSGTKLVLTYDEPLDTNSVPETSDFSVTVDGTAATVSSVGIAGLRVTLTLASAVSTSATVTLSYTPGTNQIQDPTTNTADGLTNQSVTVTDDTAPVLSSAQVEGTTLTLTYDEALDTASVPAASAFSVTVNGSAVSLADTNPVAISGMAVTLTLARSVASASATVTLNYTVPDTNPIQDLGSNAAAALTDQLVTVIDTTAPTLSSAVVDGTALVLTYDEVLDTGSIPASGDFSVTVDSSAATVSTVGLAGLRVTLTLASAVSTSATVTLSYTPGTNPIQDAASNAAAALTDQSVSVSDDTAPVLSSAQVDGTTLTLTYDEALDTASVPAASAFSVRVNGSAVSLAAANPVAISGMAVTLTLANAVNEGSTVTLNYTVPDTNPIQDPSSNAAAALTNQSVTVVDTTAPMLSSATVDGTALTLGYNEVLDTNSIPASSDFSVTVDSSAATVSQVAVTGSTVVLTLATAVSESATVTLSYTPGTNPIQDPSSNAAAALTNQSVVSDETAPVLSSATVVGTALTLTYNEALDTGSVPSASAFTVRVAGSTASISQVSVTGSTVVLTLASAVNEGSMVTLNYTVPASNPIQDAATNAATALTSQTVTAPDVTAPTLSSARAVGTALTLTYNEALDTNSVPAAGAFTVTVAGSAATVSQVAVTGRTVRLTLASAVSEGSTVTLSYTVPTSNPIQDPSSNTAAALTGRSVATPPPVATLSALTVTGSDDTVLPLTPAAFDPDTTVYTVSVGNDATSARVTVTAGQSNTTLSGSLTRAGGTAEAVTMTSGTAAMLSNLTVGDNVLTITVMAAGISPRVYTLMLRREARPTVEIIGDDHVEPDTPLMLTARGRDPDGGDVTYRWAVRTLDPDAAAAVLSGAATSVLTFRAPEPSTWMVTVTVTDDEGQTGSASLTVTVDTAMRKESVKTVLAATGRRALMSALDNIGSRMGNITPGPNLTLAGQTVGGTIPGLAERSCETDAFSWQEDCGSGVRGLSMSELFGTSAFSLTLGAAEGDAAGSASPRWSVWGRGDIGSFEGRPDGLRYDGESSTLWLGADARAGSWVAGLAVSLGESEVDFDFDVGGGTDSGRLETDLTALYPYGSWTLGNGIELRGLVGVGTGEASHLPDGGTEAEQSDLSMWMVSTGMSRDLPSFSGLSLEARGDLSWVRMETGDGEEVIDGLTSDGWRMRAGLEGSREYALANDAMLEPFVEVAGRRDGGDGLSGTGFELAGGVRYHADRLSVEARGRWLAAHSENGAEEQGLSVTARLNPDTGGRGLSFALTPHWGAVAGGAQALWGEELPRVAGNASEDSMEASVDAALGYGVGMPRNALLTPFVELSVPSDSRNRVFRLGTRYEVNRAHALSLEISGEQRERESAEPDQALRLDLNIRF